MTERSYFSASELRRLYSEQRNIMAWLRERSNASVNDPTIILASYDMQAGSYIAALSDREFAQLHGAACAKFASIFDAMRPTTLLEAGVGEGTTLTRVVEYMKLPPTYAAGFDISLSRIALARQFAADRGIESPRLFTGLLQAIPLAENAVDVVYTAHALEPNRGSEEEIIRELYRVASRYVVLREPSWELGGERTRERIEEHRYVRGIPEICERLGLEVVEHSLWEIDPSQDNQAALTIIRKPGAPAVPGQSITLASPFSKTPLESIAGHLYSGEDGMVFPVLTGIPCLLPGNGIFCSHFPEFANRRSADI